MTVDELIQQIPEPLRASVEAQWQTFIDKVIDKQRLRICITDTGNGLSENDIARLFIPFERLNIEENVEGTGIGLVITKHLVELMGGTMGVDSTVDKGSTFWVELKLE